MANRISAYLLLGIVLAATLFLIAPPLLAAEDGPKETKTCDLTGASGSTCTACGMKFNEKYAKLAAYMKEGKSLKCFDDIGCMVKWRDGQCTSTQMELDYNLYVRDFNTEEELPVADAWFVIRTSVRTPMGYGIVAFKDEESAQAFSATEEGSGVMDYETMVDSVFDDLVTK